MLKIITGELTGTKLMQLGILKLKQNAITISRQKESGEVAQVDGAPGERHGRSLTFVTLGKNQGGRKLQCKERKPKT